MELSRTERWILSNQYRILEVLYPSEAEIFKNHRDAIERGYELEYAAICPAYPDDETLSSKGCQEVIDILSMYRALEIKFPGFDGNEETNQYAYARHLRDEDRFMESLKESDFNSHTPMLGRYREMLYEWNASPDKNSLTADDVRRITSPG